MAANYKEQISIIARFPMIEDELIGDFVGTPVTPSADYTVHLPRFRRQRPSIPSVQLPDIDTSTDASAGGAPPTGSPVESPSPHVREVLLSKDFSFADFRKRWTAVQEQIADMLKDVSQQTFGAMVLDSLEVNLAVGMSGSIGIASSKADASVTLTFKRSKTREQSASKKPPTPRT